jgi:MFS family permease
LALPEAINHVRSRLGLNGLNFFTAAVQAGFGPFIAVWLTLNGWTLGALGLALSIGTLAALIGQLPGGMLVDQIHRKRIPAAGALIALGISALLLCLAPTQPLVWSAQIAHGLASCVMTPAIAALTLSMCGHDSYSERLGQNTRYASLGNAASAGLLGAAASAISEQSVFLVTACLVVPALAALFIVRMSDCVDPEGDHSALRHPREREHKPWQIFADPTLHVFAAAIVLFQLANAALLPVALNGLTRMGGVPGFVISATIIVPQIITAMFAPRGRHPCTAHRPAPGVDGRLCRRAAACPAVRGPTRCAAADDPPGAGRRQCRGVWLDAAADRRRSHQTHRLPEPCDRRPGASVGPWCHLRHADRRLDR